jgi:hypothetical protein
VAPTFHFLISLLLSAHAVQVSRKRIFPALLFPRSAESEGKKVVETLKNELASSSHPFPVFSVLSLLRVGIFRALVSLTFALQIDLTTSK